MTSFSDATFAVTARDDGKVFMEICDNEGNQLVNWTMPPDNAEAFAAQIAQKAVTAREMAKHQ